MKYILISFILFLLTACSTTYNVLQDMETGRCREMMNLNNRQNCLNKPRHSYDDYQMYLENKKSSY